MATKRSAIRLRDEIPEDRGDLPAAVERGGLVFLSGLTAARRGSDGRPVYEGDVAAQMRLVLERARRVLEAAGLTPADVVKTVDFVDPWAVPDYRGTAGVRREFFQGALTTATGVFMNRCRHPGCLVEVDIIAARGGATRDLNPGLARFDRLTFRPAVERNGVVWVSGTTAREVDDQGRPAYRGGVAEQARTIFRAMNQALATHGLSTKDIVKTVDYLVPEGRADYRESAPVRQEFLGHTSATGVVVQRLIGDGALLEIDAVAVPGGGEVVNPGWEGYGRLTYRPGIRAGNLLTIAGMAGNDHATGHIPPEDLAAQARQALDNIRQVVEAAGGSMEDVVKVVEYLHLRALHHYSEVITIRREFFGDSLPAVSTSVVEALIYPEMRIELEAVAILE